MTRLRWLVQLVIRPKRLAAGAGGWTLGRAWAVHLFGLALGVIAGGIDWVWWMSAHSPETVKDVVAGVATPWALAWALAGFVAIEVGAFLAGAWWSAWGAGDEKASASVMGSVKRLLALTPHAVVVSFLVWWVVLSVNPWSFGMDWRVLELLQQVAALALTVYFAWLTAAVMSPNRATPRCRVPACCEGCGYRLTGLAKGATCPECGKPAAESLRDDLRPGLWRPRGAGGWPGGRFAGLRCFFRPMRCGSAVRVFDDRRRCGVKVLGSMAGTVGVIVSAVFTIFVMVALIGGGLGVGGDELFWVLAGGAIAGSWVAVLAFVILLGTASLSGWAAGRGVARNLMPASMQIAARMSVAFPAYAAVYALYVAIWVALEVAGIDPFDRLFSMGIAGPLAGFGLFFGPHVLFVIAWTTQLARATRAARYANV